jgi:hypothetical protein
VDNSPVQEILPFLKVYLPFAFAIGSFFYFAPTWIGRHKRAFWSIFAINFLLGWTVIGWLVLLLWAVTPDRPRPIVYRGFPPEQPPEVFGPAMPPHLERIDWKMIAGGALLSIAMVVILFAIVSKGSFPLSLTPPAKLQQVVAEPEPSPVNPKPRRPTEVQASN